MFVNICVEKRLDRFTLGTKAKVDVQWRLFAMVQILVRSKHSGGLNKGMALNWGTPGYDPVGHMYVFQIER